MIHSILLTLLLTAMLGIGQAESANIPLGRGAIDEFDSILALPVGEGSPSRLVIGDSRGFLHVLEQRNDSYEEVWTSEYLEGAVSGLFLANVDEGESPELLAFTDTGRIHYLHAETYRTIWSNPPTEYERITAVLVANIDDDEQPELIFCADGRLIIYDSREQFEEWISDQTDIEATAIIVGDVDGDGAAEIVLNDGFVYDAKFRDLEWQSPDQFGDRMGLLDVDNDGIVELIGEYAGRFVRIFDVDLRREKSIEQ